MPSSALAPAAPAGDVPAQPTTCWKDVGVYGDGSCPELPRFVHCRNCPVYATAGALLLNRAPPPGYRDEWTEHFAARRELIQPSKTSGVLFRIRTEWLALPTQAFQEVAERRTIHSLPHRRRGLLLGLANVRGELLICVSLGYLLGLESGGTPDGLRSRYHRLLVVNWDGNRLAFPVDDVHGPHRFHHQEVKEPPLTLAKANPTFTQGILYWEQRAVCLLNADLLFKHINRSLS